MATMREGQADRGDSFLRLDDVTVTFPIYNASARSLKRSFIGLSTGGRIGVDADDRVLITALRNINLSLTHGDRLALVGHNGAGKTTLLRVLAGVYEPAHGRISHRGRIASLSDITIGFDPEATGHENITIRAMMLGLDRREIERRRAEIAAFSGLGDYLDVPVRTYSSGMMLRLAFAVSTNTSPDILLLDEWVSVGDADFRGRAEANPNNSPRPAGIA